MPRVYPPELDLNPNWSWCQRAKDQVQRVLPQAIQRQRYPYSTKNYGDSREPQQCGGRIDLPVGLYRYQSLSQLFPCTLIGCAKAPNGQIPPRPDPRKPSAAPQEIECGRDPSCLAANRNSQAPCTRCGSVLAIWRSEEH